MPYKINYEAYSNNFALPKKVIDDNFDSLNPIYLKVILLIYKNSYKHFSINLLSGLLKVAEVEVKNAIDYWIDKGLLFKSEITPIKSDAIVLSTTAVPTHNTPNSRELSFLLECMEGLLKRPITSVEHKSIVHILEFIRLPADVILMAIEYCISIEKVNARYIEKVCASWADKGITSHDLAEQYLTLLKNTKQNENQLKTLFGIQNRSLTDYESDAMIRWLNEYKFSIDVIKLAFEKTVAATGKVAFPYMNKILSNWYELGYKTLADITSNDNKGKKFNSKTSSYDIDELDRFWDNVPKLD